MQRPALVIFCAALSLSGCGAPGSSVARMEAYLRAAAGADSDRGWQYLSETTREWGFGDDEARYVADAAAADWDAFEWSPAGVAWKDDGVERVEIGLVSSPSSVPAFLITGRVLHGNCGGDGSEPVGLGAYVDTRPFADSGLAAGGFTGGQMKCNSLFVGDAAYDDRAAP